MIMSAAAQNQVRMLINLFISYLLKREFESAEAAVPRISIPGCLLSNIKS
jgi:hypothetical protein